MFSKKLFSNKLYALPRTALLLLVGLLISRDLVAQSVEVERPNIVIIYADDLGYGDVSSYNPERGKITTPWIDQLATQGLRFTDAHSSSGVCSPSRYTLLTGRYHWRTRLQSGIVNLWGAPVIDPDRLTLGHLAKQQGYQTACVGKWHLGWHWGIGKKHKNLFASTGYNGQKKLKVTAEHLEAWREVFSQPITGGPLDVGFDYYFGTDVPNWPPYCFIEGDRTVGIPDRFASLNLFRKNQASQQGPAIADWTLEPILPKLIDRSVEYIQEKSQSEHPFLLYLSLTSPHTPLAVNEKWQGASGLNRYADFVMETDAAVGRVMKALQESGCDKKTLVLFTSDNGCAPYVGMNELATRGHYSSGPLRGAKSDAWEGGHRVPFVVRWPEVVPAGSISHRLVHQADLLATIANILSVEIPPNAGEDSFSFLPLLKGMDLEIRNHAVSAGMNGLPAIRESHWKYLPGPGSGGWGKGETGGLPVQLYDLKADIGEANNLASEVPERVAAMQALWESLVANGRSTPGPPQENDVSVRRFPK